MNELQKLAAAARRVSLEEMLAWQIKITGLPHFEREVLFHPERKWRWDFANRDLMLAIEIQGATWSSGAHARGAGIQRDCDKHNAGVLLGWRILVFTGADVRDGKAVRMIEEAMSKAREGDL